MNREALFADETEDYRIPAEPEEGEEVCLRFRTLKGGIDRVFFIRLNKGIQVRMNGEVRIPCLIIMNTE